VGGVRIAKMAERVSIAHRQRFLADIDYDFLDLA